MERIRVLYKYQLSKDYADGNTVFVASFDDNEIKCKGKLSTGIKYLPLELKGKYIDGIFEFTSYRLLDDSSMTVKFLLGLKIKGFNEEDALWFCTYFSSGLFKAVEDAPIFEHFEDQVPKEKQKYAKLIYKAIKIFIENNALFEYVTRHGGSYKNCEDIKSLIVNGELSDEEVLKRLKNNPYTIGLTCNVPFKVCDSIAADNGIHRISTQRINGILKCAAEQMTSKGDTYMTEAELLQYATYITKKSAMGMILDDFIIARARNSDFIVFENDTYTTKEIINVENCILEKLKLIKKSKKVLSFNSTKIPFIEQECNITLSETQKYSFNMLSSNGIKILRGGPGTGKTTVVNALIRYIKDFWEDEEIKLCAPTGRAAQNMSEKTYMPAETIHRMVGYRPIGGNSQLSQTKKLEAKIYIIDEVSMLDEFLWAMFLDAVPKDSLIILVGDENQLDAVGYGSVMQDLLASKQYEVYTLTEIHRQSQESSIVINANKIKDGKTDIIKDKDDFKVFTAASPKEVRDSAVTMLSVLSNSLCLCPSKKSVAGTYSINYTYCPNYDQEMKLFNGLEYHLHDKVIMTSNNYEKGYFNGDFGIINDMDEKGIEIRLMNDEYIYLTNSQMSDMVLAYAITIHKSQGSEARDIIIPLIKESCRFIDRKALYTAITRARYSVTIIEEKDALNEIILKMARIRHSRYRKTFNFI